MPPQDDARRGITRRNFLAGALATGTLAAAGTYLVPNGSTPPKVDIQFVTGTDPSGSLDLLVDMWNQANPRARVSVTPVGGSSTRDQRNGMIGKVMKGEADVLNLDVINIPYFADQKFIIPLELENVQDFLPVTLLPSQLGKPDSKVYWAAPYTTDVGMMFQRLPEPAPSDEGTSSLVAVIDKLAPDRSHQLVAQLTPFGSASSEAFVVNVLEHALSRDPDILDPKTGIPSTALERWQKALAPMRTALMAGRVDPTDTEDRSRVRFRDQRRAFMRNWPVRYRQLQQVGDLDTLSSKIRVGSLPNGVLGGGSLAIASNAPQPEQAAEFVRFLTSDPVQRILASYAVASTRSAPYEDTGLQSFIPHLKQIRAAVEDARPRPIAIGYQDYTDRMYNRFKRYVDGTDLTTDFVDDIKTTLGLK